MKIKELEIEIALAEKALFCTTTLKEWDDAIRYYNELKVKWYQQTGEGVIFESVNVSELNTSKKL